MEQQSELKPQAEWAEQSSVGLEMSLMVWKQHFFVLSVDIIVGGNTAGKFRLNVDLFLAIFRQEV